MTYPFTAVLGQNDFKQALLISAVDPGVAGVLAMGDRGTAKSTLVRALADLLRSAGWMSPVVDLPLGTTEDRLVGALDVESALHGEIRFAPGLLAQAHEGFLYIDEVNLLDDFLVDLLLDVAASGVNIVEREGVSHRHPARFVLIGSGNPEEGRLRPQLEDRFGLSTHVSTVSDVDTRIQIVRNRLHYDADPEGFANRYQAAQARLIEQVTAARSRLADVEIDDRTVELAVRLCDEVGAIGHRGEVVLIRAARAVAALRGQQIVRQVDLREAALPALRHRISRDPFEAPSTTSARVHNSINTVLGRFRAA